MGYNTLFAIQASDLDKIAKDEDFGEKLRSCIVMADHRDRQTDLPRRGSGIFLSDLKEGQAPASDYDIQVSVPRHADMDILHVIKDGVFWSMDWTGQAPWHAYETLAESLSKMGYRTSMKSETFQVDAQDPSEDPLADEWARMGGYTNYVLKHGLLTFSLLNDATTDIAKDKTLGPRLAEFVQDWWLGLKHGHEALIKAPGQAGHLYESIGAGCHANPIEVIGLTPLNGTDLVIVGGNRGRKLLPSFSVGEQLDLNKDESRKKLFEKLRDADLRVASDALLTAGFHVRYPGNVRSEGPMHWSKDKWVTRPREVTIES